jgi:hypothetical protein
MTANPFKDIQIFYDGIGNTAVNWILDERFDDPFPHYFELQFSSSSTGFHSNEYEVIDAGTDVSFLRDRKLRFSGLAGPSHYRVAIRTPSGLYASAPKGLTGNVDKKNIGILRELLRKENLAFRKDRGGVEGYLFKRRYYGPKCDCTNNAVNTAISPVCECCLGTGFQNGYFPGVEFPILMIDPESPETMMSEVGAINLKSIQARCLAFPVAELKDIWLEKDTSRVYEIRARSIVSRYSYAPLAAQMQLRELTLADIIRLVSSSIRDIAVPQDPTASNAYYAPIIIAENPTPIPAITPDFKPGIAALVSAADSPFAELVANNALLLDKEKIPTTAENLLNAAPSATTVQPVTTVVNNVNVVYENQDSLDGGLY